MTAAQQPWSHVCGGNIVVTDNDPAGIRKPEPKWTPSALASRAA